MKRLMVLFAVAACFTAAPAAEAQEKFTIKLKELGQGDSSRVERIETQVFKNVRIIEKEKEPKTEENQVSRHIAYTETVLEQPPGQLRPTKLRRAYDKAQEKKSTGSEKQEVTQPYQGKTLVIEKKDGKYEFRREDGGVIGLDLYELNTEFNGKDQPQQKKAFIPTGPVAVNESWTIDPKQFLGDLTKDGKVDVVKYEGKAKLTKVYKKDGNLYGVIDAVFELQLKSMGKATPDQPDIDMKTTMSVKLEGCIDGSVAEGAMTGTSNFTARATILTKELGAVTSNSSGTGTIEQSWKELPPKK